MEVIVDSRPLIMTRSRSLPDVADNDVLLKKQDLRTLKQHYYPEGGWGWIILSVTFLVHLVITGSQLALAIYINGVASSKDMLKTSDQSYMWPPVIPTATLIKHTWRLLGGTHIDACWLGSLSLFLSLLISPLTIAVCRRKSTRLTAVMGGLITALGMLFTSFASQFHQLFLSYGIITGIGVGLTRDPATLMIGQYFKRKRAFVEIFMVSASGLGIAVMSVFIQVSVSNIGWRLGLQAVTGVVFVTFFLGTFYRSASLYHPQRRAILHLKSQKRKIKNKDKEKNKAQDDRPPYFDFNTLKSRTVQILLVSIAIASCGLNVPIFYMAQEAFSEGLSSSSLLSLQAYLGLSWCLGCGFFGLIVTANSKECRISRQYLCQTSLLLSGLSILTFTSVRGHTGFVLFVWIYGFFVGAFNYTLKIYIYEKVRARNFARAWGFAQFAMAIPNLIGPPIAGYLNFGLSRRSGYYFSGLCVIVGSLCMTLIDMHRRQLRKKHRRRHQHNNNNNINCNNTEPLALASNVPGNGPSGNSGIVGGMGLVVMGLEQAEAASAMSNSIKMAEAASNHANSRKQSFSEQDDFIPPIALLSHQRSFTYDDFIELNQVNKADELTVFSEEEGIADMDLPDHLFLDELEYLDNITSCNKVENCLMLSEYEQNLIKETEIPPGGANGKNGVGKKWSSLFKQPSQRFTGDAEATAAGMNKGNGNSSVASPKPTLAVGGFRQSSFVGEGTSGRSNGSSRRKHREIPTFANTSRNSRLNLGSHGQKRSITTVIEEASV